MLEFLLSPRRDGEGAKRFFSKARAAVLATLDIRSGNRHDAPDGADFLAENPGCEYNQQGLYYSYSRQHPYLNEGEVQLVLRLLISIKYQLFLSFHVLQERVSRWIKPPTTSLVLGNLADLGRGKSELIAENALLRQQLIILRRQVKRPIYRKTDRLLLVLLARMVRA